MLNQPFKEYALWHFEDILAVSAVVVMAAVVMAVLEVAALMGVDITLAAGMVIVPLLAGFMLAVAGSK